VRHALSVVAVLAMAAACASPGLPPGGPTVSAFPRVIATLPETSAVNVRPNKLLLRYDDVIGEQAAGGPLSRLVLLSPWDGEPRVEWRRTGMTIRPKGAWRTNTAYTVTVLPGVADLRGQPSPYGYKLRFSTGSVIPTSVVRGVAFDWLLAKPLAKATVTAIDVKDTSLVYISVADSSGRFEIPAMPPGQYLVRVFDEKTPNRLLEAREPWDTATVTLTDSARAELYVFVHDSTPVRINEIRRTDSVTISLQLDKPLKPAVAIPLSSVRVVLADSTEVKVLALLSAADARAEQERADSVTRMKDTTQRPGSRAPQAARRTIDPNQRRDTLPVIPPPKANRIPPVQELVLRMAQPTTPGTTYRVTLTGVQNLLGISGTATRLLIVPKVEVRDSTRNTLPSGARDSARRTLPPAPPTRRPPPR
jgi:hypothetical protein